MDEALIKRILPHSIEAEQSVIGSMLMDRDAIIAASEIVTAGDFYQHQYGVMFEAMLELFNENLPVDLITLQNRLKEKDVPPEVSSLEFVRDIITTVPTSANVRSYAKIVRDKAVLRRLIKINEDIANTCYAGKEPLEDILANTEKTIFNLLQNRNSGDFVPIRQVAMNVLEKIEEASKNQGTVTGVPTGFIDLDYKTSGLQPSDFVLIAARPSMGKTAFVLNLVDHIAVKKGLPAMVFSLEMSKEQLVNRMLAMESNVDSQKLRTGTLSDSDWDAVVEGIGVIGNSKLIIDDTPGISIMELRSRCRKMKLEYGLSVVIIDYLQLMSGSGKGGENRQQEISEISRSLKALARELSAPVIALSQLSRACETRPDHRPMLSDLRESGAIEQDADVVMFLYRDDYYNKDTDMPNIAEVIIAKQRNGPIGTVNLVWRPEYTKFANMARQ
ncbi:replicative DNA helicase [Lacrimispora xylanisolvens]|jgi:replicative DNA helicase|uniref:Replicative DNA helicase n=1 Tax=Lacrimispora xylanisolvens TaxID=384636 RepID=A0A2S6HQN3_9FIRM|nr:replicative DNA helicase [Hungatella xylanolytica]MBE5973743.1 replicative DNA helicase [Paenibacillaceae bacterium]MTK06960.1 replicative DNA helicase [Hungatella sp.]MBE5980186.1 replicative DNA helicase [Paenibacillaceae bacterium]MBE5983599.1 replicative DNA helicase [Paenibacillaceae bacterium]MBE5986585.1 replicative DNA helicase [Paenibacillaceae bacterium]